MSNDNLLWSNLKKGDKKALSQLFMAYYEPLYLYILQFTKNSFQAEDIVQGVFIYLWEKREQIEIRQSVKSYLYQSTYNSFIDQTRFEKRKDKFLDGLKQEAILEEMEEDDTLFKKKLKFLNEQIELLPGRCKEVFLLSKTEGYDYHEIADIMGISVKTVEAQMRLAFQKIRDGFKQGGLFLIHLFSRG
ncbi:MAG: RNA polymerase sigma-70 factor [Ignavibacteriae bacterium]|nr:RNA polymerase sigma-70 factor [Ignavibacteriota bacterium]